MGHRNTVVTVQLHQRVNERTTKHHQLPDNLTMAMSKIRQNFHQETEALINKQINMELYASYVYKSMATYFGRDDIALPGFSKRFKEASQEETEHADKLIDYQTMRGGKVVFRDISRPNRDEWGTALEAVEASLELEKTVNQSLLDMHKIASDHNDAQFTEFLKEQVEASKEISDLLTRMKRAGEGLGLHLVDK